MELSLTRPEEAEPNRFRACGLSLLTPELENDRQAVSLEILAELLRAIDSGKVAKEAAPDVLRTVGKGESMSVSEAIERLGVGSIDSGQLSEIIESVVRKNREMVLAKGEGAFSPLMGEVMAQARGKADGRLVSRLLKERLASMAGEESKG